MRVQFIGEKPIGNALDVKSLLASKPKMPKGWSFIGEGSTRKVYRPPNGDVIYKLNNRKDDYNFREFENVLIWHPLLPENVPYASLYTSGSDSVIVMPYYPIAWEYVSDDVSLDTLRQKIDMPDMGVYNIRRGTKGQPVLIDLGVFSSE